MVSCYSPNPVIALSSFSLWAGFGGIGTPALQATPAEVTKTERRRIPLGLFNTLALLLLIPSQLISGVLYLVRHLAHVIGSDAF